MLSFLRLQGIGEELLAEVGHYRQKYPWTDSGRKPEEPHYRYWGKEIWEQALAALLAGENLLLAGPKATGKNVLAENLAAVFGRPVWNVSFHINMDAAAMVGMDTFRQGEVCFRPGPVHECARLGGFCVLDEINMARNEALAALHPLLDYRHILDVPGYELLRAHEAARFIATMNYGYAGTRELNEALASRFAVLHLPEISAEYLEKLLSGEFPHLRAESCGMFVKLFQEFQQKCRHGEISAKAVDLRGLLDALRLMEKGLAVRPALRMGLVNKCFDAAEREMIEDMISLRVSETMVAGQCFCR